MDIINNINSNPNAIRTILPGLSVKELEEAIKLSSDSYYNTGVALISDEIYDTLVTKLGTLKPDSSVLKIIGAPIKGKKVKLPYWLGSMNKIKADDEKVLTCWLASNKGPYLVSDKLDGVSCLAVIGKETAVANKFAPKLSSERSETKMYTRGDGETGQDISHLVKLIGNKIPSLEGTLAVRGELIMTKKNFEKFSGEMANARNMVSGIVNSKPESVNKTYAKNVDFIVYEIIGSSYTPSKQLEKLAQWGFDVVKHKVYQSIDMEKLSTILQKNKSESIYEIDGIIVTNDQQYTRNTSGNPSYSFAFKGQSATVDTKVIDVLWKPSKDGYIIPRIHFKKIRLVGVNIEYTAGFHAKFINDNMIGPGAVITMVRSGDTIPYIVNVVKPAKKASLPTDMDYEWEGPNIILTNPDDNKDVIVSRITKFVRNIGVENMSEGIVTKLVDADYNTIPLIMKLTKKDLLELDGFQEKLAEKIINNLEEKLSQLNILTLMVASNIFGRGFGERKIKKILDVYPKIVDQYNPKDFKDWINKIVDIEGFDVISATKFIESLDEFQIFYGEIKDIRIIKPYKKTANVAGIFEGQNIVFTGFRDKNWIAKVEANGGKVSSAVSGNTTLLVYAEGEESSAKYLKAKSLGTKMMSKSAFQQKFGF